MSLCLGPPYPTCSCSLLVACLHMHTTNVAYSSFLSPPWCLALFSSFLLLSCCSHSLRYPPRSFYFLSHLWGMRTLHWPLIQSLTNASPHYSFEFSWSLPLCNLCCMGSSTRFRVWPSLALLHLFLLLICLLILFILWWMHSSIVFKACTQSSRLQLCHMVY